MQKIRRWIISLALLLAGVGELGETMEKILEKLAEQLWPMMKPLANLRKSIG
jgi:hypothetical protein